MGRHLQSLDACIEKMCKYLDEEEYLTQATIAHYRSQVPAVFNILWERNPDLMPYDVSRADVKWLCDTMIERKYAVNTISSYKYALVKICSFYKNYEPGNFKIFLPTDTRPNADWITKTQVEELMAIPKTPAQELAIHLEVCMGLRRVELARIEMSHIHFPSAEHNGYLVVIGKGHRGGKPRTVPFHWDTARVFNRYIEYRNSLIQKAKERHGPDICVPDHLMIWYGYQRLNPYSQKKLTGIDSLIKTVADQMDFDFANHTLRRTFGRIQVKRGTSKDTVKNLLGHKYRDQTDEYLGIIYDDMEEAMDNSPY